MIKMQLIGNVGQDARVNDVNGRKSINFSLAHNRKYRNAENVEVEQTTWVNCSYWKNSEQSVEIAKYLTAGTKVYAEGTPEVKSYKNKDGVMVAGLNLTVILVELLAVKKDEANGEPERAGSPRQNMKPNGSGYEEQPAGPDGDDLPF